MLDLQKLVSKVGLNIPFRTKHQENLPYVFNFLDSKVYTKKSEFSCPTNHTDYKSTNLSFGFAYLSFLISRGVVLFCDDCIKKMRSYYTAQGNPKFAKGKYIINYGLESERVYLMSGDVSLAAEFPKTNVSFSDYFDMKLYIPGVEKIQSVSFFILLH